MSRSPKKLTPTQLKQMRRKWANGWTGKELREYYDVTCYRISFHCKDLPKNRKRRRRIDSNVVAQQMPVIMKGRQLSIMQLKNHMPHFLLYLFCTGTMSTELMDSMADQNRELGQTLKESTQGLTMKEIIRDHPLLLVRNMIRQERFKPFKRPGEYMSSEGRTMGAWKGQADLDLEIMDNDPDLFNPKSDLMRDTAATAIHYALNPPDPQA